MLSAEKLKQNSQDRQIDVEQIAKHLVKAGRNQKEAVAAVKNWQRGLFKPQPHMAVSYTHLTLPTSDLV